MEPIILAGAQQGRQFSFSSKVHRGISQKNAGAASERASGMRNDRKTINDSYLLKSNYFLSRKRGKKIFEAVSIMQDVGIEMMMRITGKNFKRKRAVIVTKSN